MCNNPDLSDIDHRVRRLEELLGDVKLTSLDFDNREHLHVIQLCLDMAIDRLKKIK
jgi:hypothetical protein